MIEAIGPTLVCSAITEQARAAPPAARRRAHRSPEPRSGADDSAQLAAAARRQHRRVPVPRAGVPDGVAATCADADPVLHRRRRRHVLRQLPARQRAGGGAARRAGTTSSLTPVYTPTRTDERNVSQHRVFVRRHQRLPRAAFALFRHTPRFLDRLWDAAVGHQDGVEAADQGRSEEPRRADGLDAARASRGFSARRSTSCSSGCGPSRVRRRQPAVLAAASGMAAPLRRALKAAGRAARCRAKICFSTASASRTSAVARADPRRRSRTSMRSCR